MTFSRSVITCGHPTSKKYTTTRHSAKKMNFTAYFTTPRFKRSFIGRWLWVTQKKGSFSVSDLFLECRTSTLDLRINKDKIESIGVGIFPRTAKQFPYRYIDIGYLNERNEVEHIFVVAHIPKRNPWLTPIWTMNKHTLKVLEHLTEWRQNQSR